MEKASPGRILLVEDDGDLLEVLQYVLEDEGYEVSTSTDGPDAIALATATPFDLVILDISLATMNGVEVARALRADTRTAGIAIAIHTGLAESAVRAQFTDYDLFMPKVDDVNVLLGWVNDAIAAARSAPARVSGPS
jgi:CheY-like chemotaxis protein